jgi:hypothetical protein
MRKTTAFVMMIALAGAMSPLHAAETVTYSYDYLGRLTKVVRSGGPASGATVDITQDAMANRTRLVSTKGQSSPGGSCTFNIEDAAGNSEFSFDVIVRKTGTCAGNVAVNYDDGLGHTGQMTFTPSDNFSYFTIRGTGSNCYSATATATITIASGPGAVGRGAATVTVVSNC